MPQEHGTTFQPDQNAISRRTAASHPNRGPLLARSLGALGLASAAIFMGACSSNAEEKHPVNPNLSSTPAAGANHWADPDLASANDPRLKSVEFYFDKEFSGGSLALKVCFKDPKTGEIRITSRQTSIKPGWLYNRPTEIAKDAGPDGCHLYHPVTNLDPDEQDRVNVGTRDLGEPHDNTYTGRAYDTTRNGSSNDIAVQFSGQEKLDPDSIKPRDPQPAGQNYFER